MRSAAPRAMHGSRFSDNAAVTSPNRLDLDLVSAGSGRSGHRDGVAENGPTEPGGAS